MRSPHFLKVKEQVGGTEKGDGNGARSYRVGRYDDKHVFCELTIHAMCISMRWVLVYVYICDLSNTRSSIPFAAVGESHWFDVIDRVVSSLFMFDIVANFCTGMYWRDGLKKRLINPKRKSCIIAFSQEIL